MTDYQNRAERRSVQLVELRKIRTEYKQEMKAFRSKYFNYNTKKFRKTLFYQHLKPASQMNTAVDSPATGTYQEEEEGNIRVIYDRTNQTVENTHATYITEEAFSIQTDKKECGVVEASSSGTDTVTVMADEEVKVIAKDVNSTQDVNSFKLKWNILPFISLHMFDCSDAAVNAADRENTKLGKNKKGTEEPLDEKDDDVRKNDEAVQQQEEDNEMLLLSEKKIDSSFCEKSMKEVPWMVTPSASIKDVIRGETASFSMGKVKKSSAITAIREVAFSPVEGVKKKRLRSLKKKTGTVVPKIKTVWKRVFN
ncbi:hypothetical protein EDC94DRAFT_690867 [Helicostylum pulchrum]|nr:hypothetical protein EDC94DRAFT_690867 [Helicostylum pulchrum]